DSPVFQQVSHHLTTYITHNAGSSYSDAIKQGHYVLLSNVSKQAFIQGVDDDFLLSAIITLIGGIPVVLLHTKKKKEKIALKKAKNVN
ncbi:MAG TPA: hypothetical protein VE870_04860, partial [Bacteroidales bacterium]|nr:hypothetical protein [Bacteroidales bacterium]